MIGLFDRDVFIKLGCCNLWIEALEVLAIDQPYRLDSTGSEDSNRRVIFRRMRSPDADDALHRVMEMVHSVPTLPDDFVIGLAGSAEFQSLSECEGIDGGEQILASLLMRSPDGKILVSGDKRFFGAMREQRPEAWGVIESRVISFERCLLSIVHGKGLDSIYDRLRVARDCDGALRLACGDVPNEAALLEALHSYDPLT